MNSTPSQQTLPPAPFEQKRLVPESVRFVVAAILSLLVGGLSGLLAVLVIVAILYSVGGWDSASKHGISEQRSCRLGGVILVVYPVCVLGYHWFSGDMLSFSSEGITLALLSLGIFALGFFEDLTSVLSPVLRLGFMLAGGVVLLLVVPDLVIQPLGIWGVDWIFEIPLLAYPITVLALAFLPNAFNISDGANGLLSGVCLLAMLGLMKLDGGISMWPVEVLFSGCLIFFFLNVVTGRLFLGDGGAYLLGLLVGIMLIYAANGTNASPWLLAMFIFYPMTDFLFSMLRRVLSGRSAMLADNEHFHNLLFQRYRIWVPRSGIANTMTGITIASIWPGIPVLLLFTIGQELNWGLIYAFNWIGFVLLWFALRRKV